MSDDNKNVVIRRRKNVDNLQNQQNQEPESRNVTPFDVSKNRSVQYPNRKVVLRPRNLTNIVKLNRSESEASRFNPNAQQTDDKNNSSR